MEKYVLAIGELLIDGITSVAVNNLSGATALHIHPGGSPGNFCRYLKRCGTPAALIATVGNDGLGHILLNKIQQEGIDTALIHVHPQHNTSFIVVARTHSTPDFIAYRHADRFIPTIAPQVVQQAALVHTTAFALSKDPAQTNILHACKLAWQSGIPVSVDWNYAEEIWGAGNNAHEVFTRLQQYQPYFKFSLDDIERFTGQPTTIDAARTFLDSIQATAICLTCGSQGVYYKTTSDNKWQFIPAQKITVRNATGAGDAFWAGFISGIHAGLNTTQAVQRGIYVASIKLQNKWPQLQLT
jgi:fructokinase